MAPPSLCDKFGSQGDQIGSSLRSKRFRLVSVLAAREMKQEPKNESGNLFQPSKQTRGIF